MLSIPKMQLKFYIQLIFLCLVNVIFTFTGIVSNTLVIASFWKSSKLRKKLCHFMIMLLSFFDLVSVVMNHSTTLFYLISWLREDYDLLVNSALYVDFITIFYVYSFFALLVMSFERYMGAYYPIFHHTSVTRRRLLTLLAILLNKRRDHFVILVFIVVSSPPLLCMNFKLFKISPYFRCTKTSPGERTTLILKVFLLVYWLCT